MRTNPNIARETTLIDYNGQGGNGSQARDIPAIVLRNGLPIPILPQVQVSPGARHLMIRTAAYFLAEQRGFLPGHEMDDWLTAEGLVGQTLAGP